MLLVWALMIVAILEILRRLTRYLTGYSTSPNRTTPFVIPLSDSLDVVSEGPVHSNMFKGDFLPASIRIRHHDQLYYIDPFYVDDAQPAAAILISHDHPDHFSPSDIRRVYQTGKTRLIGPPSVATRLPDLPVEILKPGESISLNDCTLTGIPAYTRGIPTHPRHAGYLGFLLTCSRLRIYHAGDTHAVPEMDLLTDLSLAIVPIQGRLFTLTTEEAVGWVLRMQPNYVFPLHYPLGRGAGAAFSRMVGSASTVLVFPENKQPS